MKRKISMQLFGMARSFCKGSVLSFEVPDGTSLDQLREYFAKEVRIQEGKHIDPNTLQECAIAGEDEILSEEFIVRKDMDLAILPPVCGG